jgi:hypothetical protein
MSVVRVPTVLLSRAALRLAGVFHGRPQALSGICVAGFAAFAIALALTLPVGTVTRMGPGFLPLTVGAGLFACGLIIALSRSSERCAACTGSVRSTALTLLAIALFAVLVEPAGALFGSVVLGVGSALAAGLAPLRAALAGGTIGVGCTLLFVYGLAVPLRLWPAI